MILEASGLQTLYLYLHFIFQVFGTLFQYKNYLKYYFQIKNPES